MPYRDRGDIVLGWLTRLVAIFAVFGVVGYDGVSVIYTHVSAADAANQAARSASDSWSEHKDIEAAYGAAELTAEGAGGTVPRRSMSIYPDGMVNLSVSKTAPTLILQRLGGLRTLATAMQAGQAKAVG